MAIAAFNKTINVKTTSSSTWLIAPGTAATLSLGGDLLDDTDFTSTGYRSRIIGLRDYSVSMTMNYDTSDTAFVVIRNAWLNRTRLDFRYLPNGTNGFQGQCQVETFDLSGDVGGLEQTDTNLVADGALSTA